MFTQNINYIEDKNSLIPIDLFIKFIQTDLITLKNFVSIINLGRKYKQCTDSLSQISIYLIL